MGPELLLPLLILVPLLGGVLLLLLPGPADGAGSSGEGKHAPALSGGGGVRIFTLVNTLASFVLSLLLLPNFDWSASGQMQLRSGAWWVEAFGLSFGFGIDSISLWLILLTTFLMPLVVLGSWSSVTTRVREFHLWLLLLQAAMVGTFVATDLIFFYICFEFTLVPLYFLIGIYGSTQRLKAARVFFLYTFTGSMLTFAGVLYVAWFNRSLDPQAFGGLVSNPGVWTFAIHDLVMAARQMSAQQQTWVLLALLSGFAVKVPLFPVHTWLPLAHTEAPTAGSVILAGVLLKLGTYGLIRLAIPMVPVAVAAYAHTIAVLAIIGILYTGLICWVQKDLKKLIAYSSVSHLGFCVLGMFALNVIGGTGSVMYMINHGLSTGALFLCVGMIYERLHTREMAKMSGLARVMPVWSFFMVFFCLASVGLPGLNGFVGEFLTLLGAFDWRTGVLGPWYAAAAGTGMIVGAIYILYMVGKVVFGPTVLPAHDAHADHSEHSGGSHSTAVKDLNLREIATLTPLAVACVWLGVYPLPVLRSLEQPVARLTAPALAEHPRFQHAAADHAPTRVVLNSDVPITAPLPEYGHRTLGTEVRP